MTDHLKTIHHIAEAANITPAEVIARLDVMTTAMVNTVAELADAPRDMAHGALMHNLDSPLAQEMITDALAFILGFEYELTEGGRK